MPHDGHVHAHSHAHSPGHSHKHAHGHSHGHAHPHDHNGAPGMEHLHSHPIGNPGTVAHDDQIQDFVDNFIAGFRASADKTGFLRLAKVPFELADDSGAESLKLVDVTIEDGFQVATASPAFGVAELVYQPFPGRMVRQRTDMRFVYVSLRERRDLMLTDMARLIATI